MNRFDEKISGMKYSTEPLFTRVPKDSRNGYIFKKKPWPVQQKTNDKFEKEFPKAETQTDNSNEIGKRRNSAKLLLYFCLILLPTSMMATIVGVATPYWFNANNSTIGSIGLFQACTGGSNACQNVISNPPAKYVTSIWFLMIGLECSGVFLLLIGVLCLACIYPKYTIGTQTAVAFGAYMSIIIFTGAALITSGVLIMLFNYAGQFDNNLDWSFYLTASGGGLAFVVFCLLVTHVWLTSAH